MTICERTRTITLTKKEMTTARHFGSDNYKALQEARRDYPGFAVITATRKVTTQRETYKGLTYEYMEKYIKAHDDAPSWPSTKCIVGHPTTPPFCCPNPRPIAK